MPKKEHLQAIHDFNFEVLGIVADVKEYTMAWLCDRWLHTQMERLPDITFEFKRGETMYISNYISEHDFATLRLIRNRAFEHQGVQVWLLPEFKHLDYLLYIKTEIDWPNVEHMMLELKAIKGITFVQRLHVDEIKSKENLLF